MLVSNNLFICESCGKSFSKDWRKDRSIIRKTPIPRFCCISCKNRYSSKKAIPSTKTIQCKKCGKPMVVDYRTSSIVCESCKKEHKSLLKEEKLKPYKELLLQFPQDTLLGDFIRSKRYTTKSPILKKLGFDYDNNNIEEEFNKVRDYLYEEYIIKEKSAVSIEKELELPRCLSNWFLDLFGIPKRSISQAVSLTTATRAMPDTSCEKAKHITERHVSWEGKSYFLRSSYEIELAYTLDALKIPYEVESYRFKYFDSQKNKERTAIPDFKLDNCIIEVKGDYTFDALNLLDREAVLKNLGIPFYIILEKTKILTDFYKEGEEVYYRQLPYSVEDFLKCNFLKNY